MSVAAERNTLTQDNGAVVVKLGGDVLDGDRLQAVAADLATLHRVHPRLAVVHGGGAQVTALAGKLGLPTRIIAGRRVTDAATLEVLKYALAGALNIDLCVALRRAGLPAIGLHAGSATVRATRRPPVVITGGPSTPVDLGLVGDVAGFDLALLEDLLTSRRLPVLSCLGYDDAGADPVLNLNADLVASRLAAALSAEALVAVTKVGGVRRDKDDPDTRIRSLTIEAARAAIANGLVQGGMIPKLEESFVPLAAGVRRFVIAAPGDVAQALAQPGAAGTTITA